MLNPWLSFGFQTARHGWEAQSAVLLSFMRMFSGSAFDDEKEHLAKQKGIAVSKVQSAATPVEEHSMEGRVTQEVTDGSTAHKTGDSMAHKTEGSTAHKKAAPQNRLAERARKGSKASAKKHVRKHAESRSSPAKRSRRKRR